MTTTMVADDDPDAFDEAHVSFRLFGETLDPDVVTQALGVAPSASARRGERPVSRTTGWVGRPRPRGLWVLTSTIPPSAPLAEHLEALLGALDARVVQSLAAQGWTADFLCDCFPVRPVAHVDLSPEVLAGIAALGASLRLAVHSFDPPEQCEPGTPAIPLP